MASNRPRLGTTVTVTYDVTALAPAANAEVQAFAAGYAEYLDGWRDRIARRGVPALLAGTLLTVLADPGPPTEVDNRRMGSDRSGWGRAGEQPSRGLGTAALLRHTLLWASRRRGVQRVVSRSPLTRRLVRRFVAGEGLGGAVGVVRSADGTMVSRSPSTISGRTPGTLRTRGRPLPSTAR